MVRHHLKGFTQKRDPTGIIHSLNARGIKTGRSKRPSKYNPQQLMDFAAMRRAQTQRQTFSEPEIPPIEPVPEIPTSNIQLTPPKEKATTFSFAQPGEGEEPSLSSSQETQAEMLETEPELKGAEMPEIEETSLLTPTVSPPPEPPRLGEF